MKVARLYAPKDMRFTEIDTPEPDDNEVLCKVIRAGICGTDYSIYTGQASFIHRVKFPMTPGHEWSGIVERVGKNVTSFKPGVRVIGDTAVSCGNCYECLIGLYSHCKSLRAVGTINTWDGAFAEYIVMPQRHLFHLPDNVDFDNGAMVEPAATGLFSIKKANVATGDNVLVLGSGPIGIIAAKLAKISGAMKVVIAGRKQSKLDLSLKLGIDNYLNTNKTSLVEGTQKLFGKAGIDKVIEASGSIDLLNQIIPIINEQGIISLVAFYDKKLDGLDLDTIVLKELKIVGSPGSLGMYKPVLDLMSSGSLNLSDIITRRCKLEEIKDIFDNWETAHSEKIKIMVDIN